MPFRNLLIKELKTIFPLFAVYSVLVVLSHLFILAKSSIWDNDTIFVLSAVMPFLFVSVIALGTGYYQLYSEWKTNSIYLLLSLPVRGWKVLTAKLAAVLLLLILAIAGVGASFSLLLLRVKWDEFKGELPLPTLLNVTANSFWMYGLVVIFLLAVIQFAFLCGQLVAKFRWLMVFAAFLSSLWLVVRISPLFSNLLMWIPEIPFGGEDTEVMYLHSGPFIVLFILSVGLIGLSGYILEKEVEV
ncbi:MAG: hypothetical protein K0R28_990 [Paenibacillus sp.]|jgi:hypothetical protein|nr:hypothetical protein [Paenibacillus sp.]